MDIINCPPPFPSMEQKYWKVSPTTQFTQSKLSISPRGSRSGPSLL